MGEGYVLMGLSLIWKNQKYPFTNPDQFGVFYLEEKITPKNPLHPLAYTYQTFFQ